MEDEATTPASPSGDPTSSLGVSSFWLDACEDIPCDLINDLVDFHPSIAPASHTSDHHNLATDFFGGIDHILDTIKNGTATLSPATEAAFYIQNQASGVCDMLLHSSTLQSDDVQIEILPCNGMSKDDFDTGTHTCQRSESDNGFKQPNGCEGLRVVETPNRNGVKKHVETNIVPSRDWGCDDVERSNKRPRISNGNNEIINV